MRSKLFCVLMVVFSVFGYTSYGEYRNIRSFIEKNIAGAVFEIESSKTVKLTYAVLTAMAYIVNGHITMLSKIMVTKLQNTAPALSLKNKVVGTFTIGRQKYTIPLSLITGTENLLVKLISPQGRVIVKKTFR